MTSVNLRPPLWTLIAPALTLGLLALQFTNLELGGWYSAALAVGLIASVMAAVHHAEVIAYGMANLWGLWC